MPFLHLNRDAVTSSHCSKIGLEGTSFQVVPEYDTGTMSSFVPLITLCSTQGLYFESSSQPDKLKVQRPALVARSIYIKMYLKELSYVVLPKIMPAFKSFINFS